MMSGVVTGFAIRMKNYHLKDFPLNEGVIYPQVKMALVISSKYDLAVINDCGMIVIDFTGHHKRPNDLDKEEIPPGTDRCDRSPDQKLDGNRGTGQRRCLPAIFVVVASRNSRPEKTNRFVTTGN